MNSDKKPTQKADFETREMRYATELQIKNERALLELREKREYLDQRKTWSSVLLGIIFSLVLFTFLFTLEVGIGNWIFKDEWLVRLIYVTFFASIIGLASIVVNFLFPKSKNNQEVDPYNPQT